MDEGNVFVVKSTLLSSPCNQQSITKNDNVSRDAKFSARDPKIEALLTRCRDTLLLMAAERHPDECELTTSEGVQETVTSFAENGEKTSAEDTPQKYNITHSEVLQLRNNSDEDSSFFLKFLLDNNLYQAITIPILKEVASLSCASNPTVRLWFCKSPENTNFPGTELRALSIRSNSFPAVLYALDLIVQVSFSLCVATDRKQSHNTPTIRLAVPRLVVGSIIGKNGVTIQQLRSELGAHIHISPLFVPYEEACSERIVQVVSKDKSSIRNAVRILATKINHHPSRASQSHVIYEESIHRMVCRKFSGSNRIHETTHSPQRQGMTLPKFGTGLQYDERTYIRPDACTKRETTVANSMRPHLNYKNFQRAMPNKPNEKTKFFTTANDSTSLIKKLTTLFSAWGQGSKQGSTMYWAVINTIDLPKFTAYASSLVVAAALIYSFASLDLNLEAVKFFYAS